MAGYSVTIKPSAATEIESIGTKLDRQRIVRRILALTETPRPAGCEKLAGYEHRYRIRQGHYRIVYQVLDTERLVDVIKVAHRREVYR